MYTVKMFPEVIQEGCGYRLHDCLGSEQLASWDGRILMKLAGENLEAQIPKSVPGFALSINNEHATVTPLNPDRVKLYVVDEKKENIDPDLIRYMGELFKQQSILLVHSESRAIRKFKENFAKIFENCKGHYGRCFSSWDVHRDDINDIDDAGWIKCNGISLPMINSHQERLNSFSDEICEYFSLSKEDLAAEGLFSVSEDLYCMRIVNNDRSLSVISRKRCLLACTNCNHRVCLWGKRDPGEKPDTSKLDTRHYENCKSHERLKKDFHNVCYDDRTVRTKSYRIVNPILENPPRDIDIRFLTDICPDSYIDVFDENNKKNALMITDLEINEILRKIAKHQTENNIIKHVNLIKEDDYNYCTRVNTLSKIDEKYYDASDLKIYIDKYSELLEQVPKPLTQKQSILCSLFDTAKTELPIIYGAYRILTCLFENGENINDSCFRKSIKHNMVTQHVEAVSRGGALLREVVEQNLPTPSDGSPPTAESKLGNGKYSLAASLSEDCQNEDVIGINTVVTAWPLLEAEKEYRGICEVGNALVSELTKITFVNNASYQAISRRKFAFV